MAVDRELIRKKLDILADFIRQIDIATHLIAGSSLPRQETAKDAFELLANNKIITPTLAKNMALASSFRNIVVHGYQKIDFKRLYYDYKEDLDDLRTFAKEINEFINK